MNMAAWRICGAAISKAKNESGEKRQSKKAAKMYVSRVFSASAA